MRRFQTIRIKKPYKEGKKLRMNKKELITTHPFDSDVFVCQP